jgi:hypothetical protein
LINKYKSVHFLNPCRHNQPPSPTLVEQDKRDIEYSNAVLVHIKNYSAGTLMELFFSFAVCNKLTVVCAPVEFHDDQWIRCHCSYMCTSVDAAMDFLKKKLHIEFSKSRLVIHTNKP